MTDERLAELRADLQSAVDERTKLKRTMEDAAQQVQRMAAEVQRINTARKELAEPYKVATERVADLTAQIQAEEQRRAEEAKKAAEQSEEAKV